MNKLTEVIDLSPVEEERNWQIKLLLEIVGVQPNFQALNALLYYAKIGKSTIQSKEIELENETS